MHQCLKRFSELSRDKRGEYAAQGFDLFTFMIESIKPEGYGVIAEAGETMVDAVRAGVPELKDIDENDLLKLMCGAFLEAMSIHQMVAEEECLVEAMEEVEIPAGTIVVEPEIDA